MTDLISPYTNLCSCLANSFHFPVLSFPSQQIWKLRTEYWYRRVAAVPDAVKAAKGDFTQLWNNKLSQPSTWTGADLVAAGIIGVQLAGCFAIGETLSRNKVIGYDIGNSHGHH
jgi:hypothetical protein